MGNSCQKYEELTSELTEMSAASLFALGLKPASQPHTRSQHLYHWVQGNFMTIERALAQAWAKVQAAPQGCELLDPVVYIYTHTSGDRLRATFSNESLCAKEHFPLSVRSNPDPQCE